MQFRALLLIVTLALGLLAAPLAAGAQQAGRVWRIGLFHVGSDHTPPPLQGLREGLKALGYEDGKNIRLDLWNVADEEEARGTAEEFVRHRVDLVVAFENLSARAAAEVIWKIPVVFFYAGDPVADGLVQSLTHPGGNMTGVVEPPHVYAKQMELFKEIVPGLRQLLILLDPHDSATGGTMAEVQKAGAALDLRVVERPVTTGTDIERAIRSVKRRDVDGVLVASARVRLRVPARMARLALEKSLPLAGVGKELAEEGALFSYTPDPAAIGRAAAGYVDKILKGAKPGDLPLEQPPRFELVINLKTAKTLGLTIPQSVLSWADEVIQ